jgi:hypothetical protein
MAATAAARAAADTFAQRMLPLIAELRAVGVTPAGKIARELNGRGVASIRGGRWTAKAVIRVMQRARAMGEDDPVAPPEPRSPAPRLHPGSSKPTVGPTEPPSPSRSKKGDERAAEIYALAIAEGRPIEEVALRIGLSNRMAQRVLRKLGSVQRFAEQARKDAVARGLLQANFPRSA